MDPLAIVSLAGGGYLAYKAVEPVAVHADAGPEADARRETTMALARRNAILFGIGSLALLTYGASRARWI